MIELIKKISLFFCLFYISFFVFCQKKIHTVTILYDHPPRTLDPHLRNEIVTISILSNIYEALVDYTPDLRITPCLAKNWYQSDSLTWIFDLRENVFFHNGKEMKAQDVVYSLYRPIREKESERSGLVRVIDTIYAINSYRIVIKTKFPYYSLLNELDLLYIVPSGYNNFSNPVGTGPYRNFLISEDSIICDLYQNYWGKKPMIVKGVFKFIPELEERIKLLKSSESCIIYGVPVDLYYKLKDSIKMEIIANVATRYLQFNLKKHPFDNKDFRRALSMAINRQEIDNELYYGLAEPANQFVPKGLIGYCPDLPPLEYNPDSAGLLIKKFNKIKINLYYGKPLQRLGNKIACYLCAAGIEVNENPLEIGEFWSGVEKRKFDLYLISSLATNLDGLAGILLTFLYTYNPDKKTGLMNRSGFSNPTIDSLIDFAFKIEDPEQRLSLIKDIQMLLLKDMPIVPIVWEPRIYGISKNIKFKPRIDQTIRLKEIKFSR
ncbi:MAG: ABC transporter substrate-binding protein [candidate division WOR-3 bacterium]